MFFQAETNRLKINNKKGDLAMELFAILLGVKPEVFEAAVMAVMFIPIIGSAVLDCRSAGK